MHARSVYLYPTGFMVAETAYCTLLINILSYFLTEILHLDTATQ